jgi:hypothetical protein
MCMRNIILLSAGGDASEMKVLRREMSWLSGRRRYFAGNRRTWAGEDLHVLIRSMPKRRDF